MLDLLSVSEGLNTKTEINDLNTFTTRVEKLGKDVESWSSSGSAAAVAHGRHVSAPRRARFARGRWSEETERAARSGRKIPATW